MSSRDGRRTSRPGRSAPRGWHHSSRGRQARAGPGSGMRPSRPRRGRRRRAAWPGPMPGGRRNRISAGASSRPPRVSGCALSHDDASRDDRYPGPRALRPRPCSASSRTPSGPAAPRLSTRLHAWRRAAGSNPVVGSSRNSRSGSPTMARATSSLRSTARPTARHPAFAAAAQAYMVDGLADIARPRVVPRVSLHQFPDGQLGGHMRGLQHEPNPGPPGQRRMARVRAQHADLARVPPGGIPPASQPSWSCPRRSGPGTRIPRRAARRGRCPGTASTFPYRFRSPVTEITAVSGPGVMLPARGRVGTVFIASPPRGGDTTRTMRMPQR